GSRPDATVVSMAAPSRRRATLDDLVARGDTDRLEIVDGEIVEKAMPSPNHELAKAKLGVVLDTQDRESRWWISTTIHTGYADGDIYRHDAAGWRRDRLDARANEWLVRVRPDWVCEIVSPKDKKRDLVNKPRTLHAAG